MLFNYFEHCNNNDKYGNNCHSLSHTLDILSIILLCISINHKSQSQYSQITIQNLVDNLLLNVRSLTTDVSMSTEVSTLKPLSVIWKSKSASSTKPLFLNFFSLRNNFLIWSWKLTDVFLKLIIILSTAYWHYWLIVTVLNSHVTVNCLLDVLSQG